MKFQALLLKSCSTLLATTLTSLGLVPAVQPQVLPDSTLGENTSIVSPIIVNQQSAVGVTGGATRGTNLFHSFSEFNVLNTSGVYFINPSSINNIFARVTGITPSTIDGVLGVLGPANLFLINPNGIIFGPNGSLDLQGSFLATTASRIIFSDATTFNADSSSEPPLLTASIPIGLQFGNNPGSIINQSQANPNLLLNSPRGLNVPENQTLALIGSGIIFDNSILSASSGRVEIGSVAANSVVDLSLDTIGFTFDYGKVQDFKDISLNQSFINLPGFTSSIDLSASLNAVGRVINLESSNINAVNTNNNLPGENLTLTASERITLDSRSTIFVLTLAGGRAGNLILNTSNLEILEGSQLSTATLGRGRAGDIVVNASNSVVIAGTDTIILPNGDRVVIPSSINSSTQGIGDGGNIEIRTRNLTLQGFGVGLNSDSANMNASSLGQGGRIGIEATDQVRLLDGAEIRTSTRTAGAAGSIEITTSELSLDNGAAISVDSQATGPSGDVTIHANRVLLNNSDISATSQLGNGGDLNFFVQDSLELRNQSQISTTAGMPGGFGDGGNIRIESGLVTLLEDSDIVAQAFLGQGGNINITTNGLFLSADSIISASSEQGVDGVVQTNEPENSPAKGIFSQPVKLEDLTQQINPLCRLQSGKNPSRFVATGRGGVAETLDDPLVSDSIQEDLGRVSVPLAEHLGIKPLTPSDSSLDRNISSSLSASQATPLPSNSVLPQPTSIPNQIVEAQGWVINSNGDVVLSARAQPLKTHNPWINPPGCRS